MRLCCLSSAACGERRLPAPAPAVLSSQLVRPLGHELAGEAESVPLSVLDDVTAPLMVRAPPPRRERAA
jgi:hypothetical protein